MKIRCVQFYQEKIVKTRKDNDTSMKSKLLSLLSIFAFLHKVGHLLSKDDEAEDQTRGSEDEAQGLSREPDKN